MAKSLNKLKSKKKWKQKQKYQKKFEELKNKITSQLVLALLEEKKNPK